MQSNDDAIQKRVIDIPKCSILRSWNYFVNYLTNDLNISIFQYSLEFENHSKDQPKKAYLENLMFHQYNVNFVFFLNSLKTI
jgi:hypothetical protein